MWFGNRMSNKKSTRPASVALIERIESRRMLSAAPVSLHGGVLQVRGSAGDDVIRVQLDASDATKLDVVLNGTVSQFDLSAITRGIKIDGRSGNDDIAADESHGTIIARMTI